MRYTGPKNRLARQQMIDLGLKTPGSKSHARLLKKLNVTPGQHGLRTRRKFSEHAYQLKEKQKLKIMFGLSESQLKKYFQIAVSKKGNTALFLSKLLEKRLDNLVFRLGFAPTRAAARQLVNHGHFMLNSKKNSIPSCQVKINDLITFSDDQTAKIPYIEQNLANKDLLLPGWLEKKGLTGKLTLEPTAEEIEKQINLRLVIEFYSR